MLKIPIYRAKKQGSDEYVTGVVSVLWDWIDRESDSIEDNELDEPIRRVVIVGAFDNYADDDSWNFRSDFVDPSTLAIHLPKLGLLSKDNEKWFVSISQNGKGSDVFEVNDEHKTKLYGYLTDKGVYLTNSDGVIVPFVEYKQYLSVVGVQQ